MKSLKLSAAMTVMKMKSVIPTIVLIPYNLDSLFYTWTFIHVYKHRGKLMLVDLTAKDLAEVLQPLEWATKLVKNWEELWQVVLLSFQKNH